MNTASMGPPPRAARVLVAFAVAAGLVAAVTGCTNTVSMTAGPSANTAACAAVQVRLPDGTLLLAQVPSAEIAGFGHGDPVRVAVRPVPALAVEA